MPMPRGILHPAENSENARELLGAETASSSSCEKPQYVSRLMMQKSKGVCVRLEFEGACTIT